MPQVPKRARSCFPARPSSPVCQVPGRWCCQVSSCPDDCQESSRGWTSFKSLRSHLDHHFMGELSGQVPLDWLSQQVCGVCTVCHQVLSSNFNGLHPRLHRASTAAAARALIDGAPSASDVFTSHRRDLHPSWCQRHMEQMPHSRSRFGGSLQRRERLY